MKLKRYKISLGVMMICAMLSGCSLLGAGQPSVEEKTSAEETSETTEEEAPETTTETTTEETTKAAMTRGGFLNNTLIDYIGENIDNVIKDMGKPDMDSREDSYGYWTQYVVYDSDTEDQIWFEFWYGDTSMRGTDPKFEKVYFVCTQARKFFNLDGSSMDIESFIKKQNVKDYRIDTHTEEDFMGDAYTVIGDVGEEVLSYTDMDGYGFQVVLKNHAITPDSQVGITGNTNYEEAPTTASSVAETIVADADVETEVSAIREVWNADSAAIDAGAYESYSPQDGVTVYQNAGRTVRIVLNRGYGGKDYSRTYMYINGQLVFAFYENKQQARLYFKYDQMFRLRYTPDSSNQGEVSNFDNRRDMLEYIVYEKEAISEAYSVFTN